MEDTRPDAHCRNEKQALLSVWGEGEVLSLHPISCADYALGKDCIMHGYMSKMGNPFLTQWQRRYFYLFPNRLEWRGEGEAPVRRETNWTRWGHRVDPRPFLNSLLPLPPAAEPPDHGRDPVGGRDTDQGTKVSPA